MASVTTQDLTRLITPQRLFSKNERQWQAWRESCTHRFLLYGGAAGGGKSFFLRWWAAFYLLALADAGIKGATVGLFCEDYPSLLDRQISKIRVEFPASLGELKEGVTRDFQLAPEYGSGRILLRNLDDPAKYLSAEFAGIAVDELTRNKQYVFDILRSRLRWPGVPRPRFVAGTNPSGIGHAWVKKYWLEREFPTELKSLADEFCFVPAKCSDNPYLSAEYHRDLETLPPAMAKAYAEGSWDVFAGQYFDNWSVAKHVDRPEAWGIKPWWPRWISVDWGFEHPSAVYWFASERDSVYTYREFVTRQDELREKLDPARLAEEICKRNGTDKPKQIFLSPDAFAKRTDQNTIAEQMGEVFQENGLPLPSPADNDRIGGWMLLYQMLDAGLLRVGDNCPSLIRCIPTLIRDEVHIEDVAKMDGDDPADSWRYGVKTMLAPREKPLGVRIQDRIEEFAKGRGTQVMNLEPQQIAMLSRKALSLETAKRKTGTRWRPGMRRN